MFVSGDPLRSPGPRGEQQRDASFVLWLNAGADPVGIRLPENDWVTKGEVVLTTDPALDAGSSVAAGEVVELASRALLVLRET
jgi:glycogen operon protein